MNCKRLGTDKDQDKGVYVQDCSVRLEDYSAGIKRMSVF